MRLSSLQRDTRAVDALLAGLPADDPDKALLQARARTYSQECGCALAGLFFMAALLLTIIYFVTIHGFRLGTGIAATLLVFAAAAVGKMTGLLLASARLALLRRSLARKLQQAGRGHVYMH